MAWNHSGQPYQYQQFDSQHQFFPYAGAQTQNPLAAGQAIQYVYLQPPPGYTNHSLYQGGGPSQNDGTIKPATSSLLSSNPIEPKPEGPAGNDPKWQEKSSSLSSWRVGVFGCTIASLLVFLVNVIAMIKALAEYGEDSFGMGTMFKRSCKTAQRGGMYIHLAINILSTILLSCNIGVMRVSNLRWVGWKQVTLWGLLLASSVPLHLFYNSAVFTTKIGNMYNVYTLSENQVDDFRTLLGDATFSKYQELTKETCLRAYATQLVSDRRNVAVVLRGSSRAGKIDDITRLEDWKADTSFNTNTARQPFDWICNSLRVGRDCNANTAVGKLKENGWRYNGTEVQYCLSEAIREKCTLQFSKLIMTIVIVCNALKLVCMVLLSLLGLFDKSSPLVTVGDAVASFMERPDMSMNGICLASKDDVEQIWKGGNQGYGAVPIAPPAARQWKPIRVAWFRSSGWAAWIWTYLPALILLSGVTVCLTIGLGHLKEYGVPVNSIPFGAVDIRAILSINYYNAYLPLPVVAMIANIPQLALSVLYFMYNRLYTSMYLCYEYEGYALQRHKPKALRVSRPKGLQRSNYFLSLPYRYSVPLMLASTLLHWLFSQSLFLARVDQYFVDGTRDTKKSISDCGYSPVAIIVSILVCLAIMAVGLGFGFFRRYKGVIPLAGSNSAAISAACLRPHSDVDGHLWRLTRGEFRETVSKPVGHCSFTSTETLEPIPGKFYS